jgi:hypothetical protein
MLILQSSEKPTTTDKLDKFLYFYQNRTNQIQFLKIVNYPNIYWEKVVFPFQKLMFEAQAQSQLEINSCDVLGTVSTDIILCQNLQVIGNY